MIGLESLVDRSFDNSVIVTREIPHDGTDRVYKKVGEYYVYTGLWWQYKKRCLEAIAKELKIDLTVV